MFMQNEGEKRDDYLLGSNIERGQPGPHDTTEDTRVNEQDNKTSTNPGIKQHPETTLSTDNGVS